MMVAVVVMVKATAAMVTGTGKVMARATAM